MATLSATAAKVPSPPDVEIPDVSADNNAWGGILNTITFQAFWNNILWASLKNSETITQTAHGFAVGDPIRHDASAWLKSLATTDANAWVAGVVTEVPDANTFVITTGGRAAGLSGLTTGSVYYLQDAGGIGTSAGTISKPVLLAISATEGVMMAVGAGGAASGGMLKSEYDPADNGIVDEAEALEDGANTVTAAQARSHIDSTSNPHSVTAAQVSAPTTARAINTQNSLQGGGDLTADRTLDLVNDVASPGNNQVYGTNGAGVRGWKADPAGDPSPLTTKGDLYTYDTDDQRLAVGANGAILEADSGEATGIKWGAKSPAPLTTKGDVYGFDTAANRLAVGADGTILEADSGEALGIKWATKPPAPLTTKGDVYTYSTVAARLGVGTNGQVLTADSAEATGIKWADATAGTADDRDAWLFG